MLWCYLEKHANPLLLVWIVVFHDRGPIHVRWSTVPYFQEHKESYHMELVKYVKIWQDACKRYDSNGSIMWRIVPSPVSGFPSICIKKAAQAEYRQISGNNFLLLSFLLWLRGWLSLSTQINANGSSTAKASFTWDGSNVDISQQCSSLVVQVVPANGKECVKIKGLSSS